MAHLNTQNNDAIDAPWGESSDRKWSSRLIKTKQKKNVGSILDIEQYRSLTFLQVIQERIGIFVEETEERKEILSSIGFFERKRLLALFDKINKQNPTIFTPFKNGVETIDALIRLAQKYTLKNLNTVFDLVSADQLKAFIELMDSLRIKTDDDTFMTVFNYITSKSNIIGQIPQHPTSPLKLLPLKDRPRKLTLIRDIINHISFTQHFKTRIETLIAKDLVSLQHILNIVQLLADKALLSFHNVDCVLNSSHCVLYSEQALKVHQQLLEALINNDLLTQQYLDQFTHLKNLAKEKVRAIFNKAVVLNFIPTILKMSKWHDLPETLPLILLDVENALKGSHNSPSFLTPSNLDIICLKETFKEKIEISNAFFEETGFALQKPALWPKDEIKTPVSDSPIFNNGFF